jgi:hypothetical protein
LSFRLRSLNPLNFRFFIIFAQKGKNAAKTNFLLLFLPGVKTPGYEYFAPLEQPASHFPNWY